MIAVYIFSNQCISDVCILNCIKFVCFSYYFNDLWKSGTSHPGTIGTTGATAVVGIGAGFTTSIALSVAHEFGHLLV